MEWALINAALASNFVQESNCLMCYEQETRQDSPFVQIKFRSQAMMLVGNLLSASKWEIETDDGEKTATAVRQASV